MKVYKEKQFLVFDFEDGKTVKYDFATKTAIGKKGKPVVNLCSQLRGLTIDDICRCCTDEQYGKFLRFVQKHGGEYGYEINNIGTILDRVRLFSNYEQIFSAGIDDIVDYNFKYTINDIPKSLIKLCKTHKIKLSNKFLEHYKKNIDAHLLAYNSEYISITDNDIYNILTVETGIRVEGECIWDYRYRYESIFNLLLNEYGYTAKALMQYIDYLKTFEAMEDVLYTIRVEV